MKEIKYKMLIETNDYTGNFCRELCAFLNGWTNLSSVEADILSASFEKEFGGDKTDEIMGYFSLFYDEHGDTMFEIENKNNLAFYFDKRPKKIKKHLLSRLAEAPKILNLWDCRFKNLKIKSVKFYKIEVKEVAL